MTHKMPWVQTAAAHGVKSLYGDLTQVPDKYSWRCLWSRALLGQRMER